MSKLLFIDVETTGLDPELHGVIQIAGIIEIDGEIKEEFDLQTNVHNGVEFDPQALLKNGKTLDDIFGYESPEVIHTRLCRILTKYVSPYNKRDKFFFIAYNAGFDMDFLRSWFKKCGDKYGIGSWCWFPYIDIMTLAIVFIMGGRASMSNFKLATVADKLSIVHGEERLHDALYDVRLARKLYKKITAGEQYERKFFEENI